jgi:hypothetical protein
MTRVRAGLARVFPAACLLALGLGSAAATPSPFEPRPFRLPSVEEGDDEGRVIDLRAEYRTRFIRVAPLELNGLVAQDVSWAEQRLRLETTFAKAGVGGIFMQADILDGVLFGDNGRHGQPPAITSGMGIASKQPNLSGWQVGLLPGGNLVERDSYGPVLRPLEPLRVNFLYGEVRLPFGIVRVGRQPVTETGAVAVHDGRSGRNRWGASFYHEAADRVLFATKISEPFRMLMEGDDYEPDLRLNHGVMLGLVYDFVVNDDLADFADDLHMFAMQLLVSLTDEALLGPCWQDIFLSATLSYRWDERFGTSVFAVPIRGGFSFHDLRLAFDVSVIAGTTREVSAGFAELTKNPVLDQTILAVGSRVTFDYTWNDLLFSLEWAYASGDADPRTDTKQTSFSWTRDQNLGLLLFEHTLAFQTARTAAVGLEILKDHEAESFPLTEISTEGRVINVNAIYPQVFWEPVDDLVFKGGLLLAWAAAPIVDPIETYLGWDGEQIEDDAVNYHGGRPANYWGTEIDLGLEWRYQDFFELALEGAYLVPGAGLRDENGDAVSSWLLETRMTFAL